MYSIRGELVGAGERIIRIEGALTVCREVEAELRNEILKLGRVDESASHVTDGVVVDLSKVEFISEDCLAVFHRVRESCHIKFQNCSLFVEAQLLDHNLLD